MEKIEPEITTIIPTFKRPNLLKKAIESALSQSYSNIKVLVIDDVSNDDTYNIVNEIIKKDKRVSYYCHKKNIGGNRNFNYGLVHVTTPFFSFLSNDDILQPEFYETAIKYLVKYPEIGFCATEVKSIDSSGAIISYSNSGLNEGYYTVQDGILSILKNGHPPCWTGIVFRTQIINCIGELDEQVGGSMDYDFVQRAAAYFPFYVSKKEGAIFSIDESSWGHASGYDYVWPSWKKMITNITDNEDIEKRIRDEFKTYYKKEFKRKIYYYGRQHILRKEFEKANECSRILNNYFNSFILSFQISIIGKILKFAPTLFFIITPILKIKNTLYQIHKKICETILLS